MVTAAPLTPRPLFSLSPCASPLLLVLLSSQLPLAVSTHPAVVSVTDKKIKDSRDAFNVAMDNGLTFFDTAGTALPPHVIVLCSLSLAPPFHSKQLNSGIH
jgi:hypothetical protein